MHRQRCNHASGTGVLSSRLGREHHHRRCRRGSGDCYAPVSARHRTRVARHGLRRRARSHRCPQNCRLVYRRQDQYRRPDHAHNAPRADQRRLRSDARRQINQIRGGVLARSHFTSPTTRGSHSVSSGIIVIAINDSTSGINQGRIATVVLSIDNLAILDSTNSTMPSGGCSSPIIRLSVIITPKCTGSMPTLTITGRRTGTRILIDAIGSRKQPTTSNRTFVSNRMMYLLSVRASSDSVVYSVTRVVVSTQPNSEAAPTINSTPAVVSIVSIETL